MNYFSGSTAHAGSLGPGMSGGGPPNKGNNQKQYVFKPKRHPSSLMKEGVSTLRYLADASQNIFQIVMPWRGEQEEEERKKQRKLKHEAQVKQQSLLKWIGTGKSKSTA